MSNAKCVRDSELGPPRKGQYKIILFLAKVQISTNTKAVTQITCPTTMVVFHLPAITPTANATMDLHHSRDVAGKYRENTDLETSGATPVCPNDLNRGSSHHVNSTQPLPSAADARPHCYTWATDVSLANNLSGEVTAAVGTFSSMNALDQVEINEQGFAILPADFFPDKFKQSKNDDNEVIFSTGRTTTFLFLTVIRGMKMVDQHLSNGNVATRKF